MRKRIFIPGTTLLLAAITGCVLLVSCNVDPLPGLDVPQLPSGWTDQRPLLDLTRNFSFVVPFETKATGNPVA
ncbi:MAG: hypothetical protein EOO05_19325 [Chitinophagaceae bacterium]|nr:MAG: hypothetical protein EOO05_19325 [Chitinophagaceae bacterium]